MSKSRRPSVAVDHRSGCPINLTLEVLGDKWSLLVIRDMIFGNRRHFRTLLLESEEGIASNILADRLKTLTKQGIITKRADPSHKQKAIYSLTEKGIQLVPILAQMGAWGRKHLPVTEALSIRAQLLEEGGPKLWERFMNELRAIHLGTDASAATSKRPTVADELRAAYLAIVARDSRSKRQPRSR